MYFIYKLSVFFHLTDEPKWRPGLKNQFYGFISGTSNLTCEAIAEPPATFIWYDKEGQPIREGMILTEDSKSTLVVMLTVGPKKRGKIVHNNNDLTRGRSSVKTFFPNYLRLPK